MQILRRKFSFLFFFSFFLPSFFPSPSFFPPSFLPFFLSAGSYYIAYTGLKLTILQSAAIASVHHQAQQK
jgi:hypothetical protein